MKWVDYASPRTLDEALKLMSEAGSKARLLAGGTDLLVQLRVGRLQPDLIVDVKNIRELNEVSYSKENGLTLGAAVPCYKIYSNDAVTKNYPGLIDSASLIGGIQIQGRATFGGNLCNAAPSADAIPAMIAHSATAKIASSSGTREVRVEDFCTGPGRTVLKPDEILVSINFPASPPGFGARYIRFIPRNEMDIAVAGAGVSAVLENGNFKSARVCLSAVGPTPMFVREAGESLAGKPVNDESIQTAANLAKAGSSCITDMRGTADYRRHLCEVLTRRALNDAVQRAKEAR